jgi:hypothetical protein
MQEQNQISTLKDAARRMEQYFAQKGVDVSHTMVLEALSVGLGERNWRTVRSLLSRETGPVQQQEPRIDESWEPEDRFLVEGQHSQWKNAYSRAFSASSAQQAAYQAVAYEWSHFGEEGELTVTAVLDRATGLRHDLQSFSSANFRLHADAFDTVLWEARVLFEAATQFSSEGEEPFWKTAGGTVWTKDEWLEGHALLELFEKLLRSKTCREDLNGLLSDDFGTRGDLEGMLRFTDSTGKDWHDSMDGYLDRLFLVLEKCTACLGEPGKESRYQVRALMAVCPDDVSIAFAFELKYGHKIHVK